MSERARRISTKSSQAFWTNLARTPVQVLSRAVDGVLTEVNNEQVYQASSNRYDCRCKDRQDNADALDYKEL